MVGLVGGILGGWLVSLIGWVPVNSFGSLLIYHRGDRAQPLYIEVPLWLSVMTVKKMSVHEANRFFDIIRKRLEYIFKNSAKPLNADQFIEILV